jgi:hypothetical protein
MEMNGKTAIGGELKYVASTCMGQYSKREINRQIKNYMIAKCRRPAGADMKWRDSLE